MKTKPARCLLYAILTSLDRHSKEELSGTLRNSIRFCFVLAPKKCQDLALENNSQRGENMNFKKLNIVKTRLHFSSKLLLAGLTLAMLCMSPQNAHATGYEKPIQWSGRYSSIAGIGVNGVGAEALYFNPAGLAKGTADQEFSFNLSPTIPQSKGPITVDNESLTSDTALLAPYSAFYNYNINPDLGVGVGAYVGAGALSSFDNVSYAGFTSYTKSKNSLVDQEVSIGVGYQVLPGLKIGAAIRSLFINAEIAGASVKSIPAGSGGGQVLTYVDYSNLNDMQFGYRLGVQYAPTKDWGVSLAWRSPVYFFANGNAQGTYEIVGNGGGLNGKGNASTDGNVTVSSVFPQQYVLGGFYNLSDIWHLYAAGEYANYAQNQQIHIAGTIKASVFPRAGDPDVQQQWTDQYTYRLGAEYAGYSWPIRFGVIYQTIMENNIFAKPVFFAPGNNSTVVVGTGHAIATNLNLDGGLEYSTDSASVSGVSQTESKNGSYSTTTYALHAGLTYVF
jgi:long-subunit fatty acid transport protein